MQGRGNSSESIWTPFDSMTTATVRYTRAKVLVAWTRVASAVNYATVGVSVVNGTDIVKGEGDIGINEVDRFDYFDETDKVIRLEYERHLVEPLGGFSMGMADILLDNTDLRFTPNYNNTIGTALRPNRPLKVFVGFFVRGQEKLIPIIEGLTLQPQENKMNRTVKVTAYDYLKWLNEKPQETAIYQDQRSDEIIADILSRAGVGNSNYILDQGLNTVGFAWFEKGQTAGDRIKQICEAEEAIFYQDESGVMRFENRDKYAQNPFNQVVWTIDPDDIVEWQGSESSQIINRVIVTGKPRSVKAEAEVWRDGVAELIPGNSTVEIWASFQDPVSGLTSPVSGTDYTASANQDGSGADLTANISILTTQFTTAAKMEITNSSATPAYLSLLRIRGTPATVDYEIQEVFQDTTSITDFNEQQQTIDNPFIDSSKFAASIAKGVVRRNKNPSSVLILKVRGIPQIQLRDQVRVKDPDTNMYTNYRVIGIQGVLDQGGFVQTLRIRQVTDNESL